MSALQEEFAQSAAKLIQKAAELGYGVTFGETWVVGGFELKLMAG